MKPELILTLLVFALAISCKQSIPESIDLAANWRFSPDEKSTGRVGKSHIQRLLSASYRFIGRHVSRLQSFG